METILSKSPLFAGLKEEQIENLFAKIVFQTRKYDKGDLIASGGDECRSLMIVVKGSVKGEMVDYSGRVLKIEDIPAPRPLAVAFLFGKNNRFPVTISANESTELLIIPKQSVVFLMQTSETFLTNFMNAVSNRAQFISGKLRFLSFKTLKGKLAHYLMELDRQQKQTGEIQLMRTQEELAELFGVARPSLSRTLRDFHHQGLIKASGRKIKILNREGLLEDAFD
ncbi:Crp/Fnr family transcriptional regulator [Marinilabilia rubra]|uniref:Crp/Fnr family transcriptional regulator n=1 Tax=Marinilabilia rubra TaxID=2162893 RepID=A0A2U2BCB0_9BACT|nr:Crp/Fnr family transcriptional regulator [Marinilabilia rubra]PWE00706.1 Crp/Fnr family transcriptional regulator [Marinilabilia rubra]